MKEIRKKTFAWAARLNPESSCVTYTANRHLVEANDDATEVNDHEAGTESVVKDFGDDLEKIFGAEILLLLRGCKVRRYVLYRTNEGHQEPHEGRFEHRREALDRMDDLRRWKEERAQTL